MAIQGQSVLGVITARFGSKRVPRKNIRPFRGKPLILWTVDEAKKSKYIDRLVLSTDDPDAARLSEIEVISRPAELCQDDSESEEALRHALSIYQADWVVLLQPTSPLRIVEDIDGCIERAQFGEACISVDWETRKTNGAVYVCKAEWLKNHSFRDIATMKYVMPTERSLDINTESDLAA